jgi:hypothetical protein
VLILRIGHLDILAVRSFDGGLGRGCLRRAGEMALKPGTTYSCSNLGFPQSMIASVELLGDLLAEGIPSAGSR